MFNGLKEWLRDRRQSREDRREALKEYKAQRKIYKTAVKSVLADTNDLKEKFYRDILNFNLSSPTIEESSALVRKYKLEIPDNIAGHRRTFLGIMFGKNSWLNKMLWYVPFIGGKWSYPHSNKQTNSAQSEWVEEFYNQMKRYKEASNKKPGWFANSPDSIIDALAAHCVTNNFHIPASMGKDPLVQALQNLDYHPFSIIRKGCHTNNCNHGNWQRFV
jgi:hypothetical protein